MNELPHDPVMLMGVVNMKLRDEYPSLDELCASMGIDKQVLCRSLGEAGFEYSEEHNRFW